MNKEDKKIVEEFEKVKFFHKIIMIQGYIKSGLEDMLEHYIVKKYEDDIQGTTLDEKADSFYEIFEANHNRGDDRDLDELYNYCWSKMVGRLPENANFRGALK